MQIISILCFQRPSSENLAKKQPNDKPVATEPVGIVERSSVAMEVVSEYVLPKYTDTEILMDDSSVSFIDFMGRFATFEVDEISIKDAEDDVVFKTKDNFEETNVVNHLG